MVTSSWGNQCTVHRSPGWVGLVSSQARFDSIVLMTLSHFNNFIGHFFDVHWGST
jgi:hypothetical protein